MLNDKTQLAPALRFAPLKLIPVAPGLPEKTGVPPHVLLALGVGAITNALVPVGKVLVKDKLVMANAALFVNVSEIREIPF